MITKKTGKQIAHINLSTGYTSISNGEVIHERVYDRIFDTAKQKLLDEITRKKPND